MEISANEIVETFEKDYGGIRWEAQSSATRTHVFRMSRHFYNKGLEDARNGGPEIDPKDIRKEDTIRIALYELDGTLREYKPVLVAYEREMGLGWNDMEGSVVSWDNCLRSNHYIKHFLINRPEPKHPDPKVDKVIKTDLGTIVFSDGEKYYIPGSQVHYLPSAIPEWESVEL